MILKLSPKWIKQLIKLPESGMGYQIVTVLLKNGTEIANRSVISCQLLVIPENVSCFKNKDIAKITIENSEKKII